MTQWGLDTLFNPGKRHMDDEKRRLQSTREEVGDSSGGRRIDLESGRVAISVRRPTDVAVEDPDGSATDELAAADTALPAVLEVEEEPAVALVNDEAEIEPEVVAVEHEDDEAVVVEAVVVEPEPEPAVATPEPAPEPEPAAPRRRALSASAWARRG